MVYLYPWFTEEGGANLFAKGSKFTSLLANASRDNCSELAEILSSKLSFEIWSQSSFLSIGTLWRFKRNCAKSVHQCLILRFPGNIW